MLLWAWPHSDPRAVPANQDFRSPRATRQCLAPAEGQAIPSHFFGRGPGCAGGQPCLEKVDLQVWVWAGEDLQRRKGWVGRGQGAATWGLG